MARIEQAGLHLPLIDPVQRIDPWPLDVWPLGQQSESIKKFIGIEMNRHQGQELDIGQIDLLLTEILAIERAMPLDQRFTPDQIVFIISSQLNAPRENNPNEDRVQILLLEYRNLRDDAGLQARVINEINEANLHPIPPPPLITSAKEAKYEEILDFVLKISKNRTLKGHKNSVSSIAISRDGRLLVSGSIDQSIKIWNIQESIIKETLKGHKGAVISVIISADNSFIVSGSDDTTVMLYRISEPKNQIIFRGHVGTVTAVALTSEDSFIVSGSRDRTIKIWEIPNPEAVSTLTGHTGYIMSVITSPDQQHILSGSEDKTIRVWSFRERSLVGVLHGHEDIVRSLAMSADSRFIVSGSEDRTIRVWDAQELRQIRLLTGHERTVNSVFVDPKTRYILSGSKDCSVRLWSFQEGSEEHKWTMHKDGVNSVKMCAVSGLIMSASEDSTINIWSLQEKEQELTLLGHNGRVNSVSISQDCRHIYSGSKDQSLKIWNIEEQREIFTFEGHEKSVIAVSRSLNDELIVTGSDDLTVKIWNIPERRLVKTLTHHVEAVVSTCISPDNKFIASVSDEIMTLWSFERQAIVWEIESSNDLTSLTINPESTLIVGGTKTCIRIWNIQQQTDLSLTGHTDSVNSVAFSPDGTLIVSGSNDQTVKVWNLDERIEKCTLTGHTDIVTSVAVGPCAKFIVSGSADCTVKVWNLSERRLECTLIGHTRGVNSVAASSDGKFIVSGSTDRSIKIWNIQEPNYEIVRRTINSVAVNHDGTRIITVGADFILNVWSPKDRRVIFNLPGHKDIVTSVTFSPDGRLILSGSRDSTLKIWGHDQKAILFTLDYKSPVQRIIISPDSRFATSKLQDGNIKILNLRNKREETFSMKSHEILLDTIISYSNKREEEIKVLANSEYFITANSVKILDVGRIDPVAKTLNFGHIDFSHFQSPRVRYNFLEALSTGDFMRLTDEARCLSYSKLAYSFSHFFTYEGSMTSLELATEGTEFALTADIFKKSPFYYAHARGGRDYTDFLIERLEVMRENNPHNYGKSILALKNDIPLLIKDSPRQLHMILDNLLVSTKEIYAKVSEELPILQVSSSSVPQIKDFPQKGLEEIPIVLQSSRFPLIGLNGCKWNADLLDAIIDCTNPNSIRSPIIGHIVQLQFTAVRPWIILFTSLLGVNIILLLLLIGLNNFELYLTVPFMCIEATLIVYEVIQVSNTAETYFQDRWNLLDFPKYLVNLIWIILELYGFSYSFLRWTIALLNLLRGITIFNLFDGTRFYKDLIFRVIKDIRHFFLLFIYSTLAFGFLFMISREETLRFDSLWEKSYSLNFGEYGSTPDGIYYLEYAVYLCATIINVILMLNLLISILSDSYEKFQIDQYTINIKEKAKISKEFLDMMIWTSKRSELKYVKVCKAGFEVDSDETWEGRSRFMEKKIDRCIMEITNGNILIENKIASIESSITEMTALRIQELEARMNESNALRIQELEKRLEILLRTPK